MAKKMCVICGERPATVPNSHKPGKLVNEVCVSCHTLRLANDMKRIEELRRRRVEREGEMKW